MKDNPYVFELDQEQFDIQELRDIFLRREKQKLEDPYYQEHHRLVIDEPYLLSLQMEYAFFGDIYNIYTMDKSLPPHIDTDRKCTINFPLWDCDTSETVVYEMPEHGFVDNLWSYPLSDPINKSSSKEAYRFTLTQPVLFNVEYPHEVLIKDSSSTRISFSWGINEMSFASTKKVFQRRRKML